MPISKNKRKNGKKPSKPCALYRQRVKLQQAQAEVDRLQRLYDMGLR